MFPGCRFSSHIFLHLNIFESKMWCTFVLVLGVLNCILCKLFCLHNLRVLFTMISSALRFYQAVANYSVDLNSIFYIFWNLLKPLYYFLMRMLNQDSVFRGATVFFFMLCLWFTSMCWNSLYFLNLVSWVILLSGPEWKWNCHFPLFLHHPKSQKHYN